MRVMKLGMVALLARAMAVPAGAGGDVAAGAAAQAGLKALNSRLFATFG